MCLAYDEKAHAAELLYKEDSYPSFSYWIESFRVKPCALFCEPLFVSYWCIELDL